MKKYFLPFGLFCVAYTSAIAQTYTQTIRGKVIDVDSKSTIVGANIILLNSDTLIGATADVNGNFRLEKTPVGRQAIKITSIGAL